MFSVRKTLRIGLFAATTFAVVAAFSSFSSDEASADGHHYKDRNAAMKSLGGNMKKLGGAVAGAESKLEYCCGYESTATTIMTATIGIILGRMTIDVAAGGITIIGTAAAIGGTTLGTVLRRSDPGRE